MEAARAGEAGEGFAVVANEVKDLAEETQAAAAEIESQIATVRETNARIDEGAGIVREASSSLEAVVVARGRRRRSRPSSTRSRKRTTASKR
ncbi:methyl-accepting chemotaxis protein [Halorubrum lacusprofundi]|uniref:methyl-accepting chemotaxis protein n=1 Tax=Halorubrum lacusprofundi TaxID=2247 RepID=UPI00373FE119